MQRLIRKTQRLGHRGDRLPSPDKPHRLLLEFQRVPRPNQSCHLKPSKADPTQSALGDVFWGQDQTMAKKQGADIYFGDAAHMRSDHHAGRTWGKKGETPIVETTGARHGMSLISAISSRGHMRFMIKESGGVNADVFIEFLKRLLIGAKCKIFLIVDRGSAHLAKKTKAFVESL